MDSSLASCDEAAGVEEDVGGLLRAPDDGDSRRAPGERAEQRRLSASFLGQPSVWT